MFDTLARHLQVWREIGVAPEYLNRKLNLFSTSDGILHSETRRYCRSEPPVGTHAHLLDASDRLCPVCTGELVDDLDPDLSTLFMIAEFAARSDISPDPFEVRYQLRRCGRMFDWLRRDIDSAMAEAAGEVRRRLARRYEQLKSELRTPDAAERIRSLVLPAGASEDRTSVLVGIRGYNPNKNPDQTSDLIIAAFWTGFVLGGYFVLSTTADVAHVLAGLPLPKPAVIDAIVAVPDGHVAVIAEMASGLWQPDDEQNLTGFAETVATARAVLEV